MVFIIITNQARRKIMGVISKFIKFNSIVFVGGAGMTAYSYPELRQEPRELMHAMVRGIRVLKAGSLMAMDYINVRHQWLTLNEGRLQR